MHGIHPLNFASMHFVERSASAWKIGGRGWEEERKEDEWLCIGHHKLTRSSISEFAQEPLEPPRGLCANWWLHRQIMTSMARWWLF
jgi:hypothetical protein